MFLPGYFSASEHNVIVTGADPERTIILSLASNDYPVPGFENTVPGSENSESLLIPTFTTA